MKRFIYTVLLFIYGSLTGYACEVIDDTGQKVNLAHTAKRIVSLAPDMTEDLFVVGAGEHIVGVVRGSDYPLQAKKIPIIASYNNVDIEALLMLHPDLIVAWAEANFVPQLKKLGIPVYLSRQRKLMDVSATLQRLGCLIGAEKTAEIAAQHYLHRYAELQKKYTDKKVLTVFYQTWPNPLITITKNSWINEVISLCGGKNVFAELKGVAPEVNFEAVITANPEVIIGTNSHNNWKKYWQPWRMIRAVRDQYLFSVNPDLIERAGPRLLDGAEEMCKLMDYAREKRG